MDIHTLLIQTLNAVQYGLLLFLIASGLTLIFGIMGIINLAHGAFYMLGAYLAYSLSSLVGNFFLAILLGLFLTTVFGAVLEWAFFSLLYKRDHLEQVLLTYGLILVFEEVRNLVMGNDIYAVPVPVLLSSSIPLSDVYSYPVYRLFISVACILVAIGLYFLVQCTRLGMTIRAGSHNREMVQSLGINVNFLYRTVFALGVSLAAFAGMLAVPVSSAFPGMGDSVLIISFVIVVIGGIGSTLGAFIAALLVGFADTFGKVFLPEFAGILIYVIMAVILVWRPEGMFSRK